MRKNHALRSYTSVYRQYSKTISSALVDAPTCFDRDRKLGPLQVLLTMQAAHFAGSREGGQSWEDALASVKDSFGEDTEWGRRFDVSRTALHQAIKKVDDEAQAKLWEVCRNLFPAAAGSTLSKMHGVLFAHIDGTQVRTQRSTELMEVVGTQTNGPNKSCHYPVAKCVLVLEAGTQRILGHEICRCKAFDKEEEPVLPREERSGWERFRDKTTENHAIIGDSGFSSYHDFADLIDAGKHFIIAVPKTWKIIKKFKASKKSDGIVSMKMPNDPSRTLTLRIFTIRDSDGKAHYIATSLREPFTLSECRRLYKTRWAIETWFRYAKQFLALRHLRSTTLHGVRLEILAILLVMQAVAAIRTAVAHHTNRITDLICTVQDGFRKAKFRAALRIAWDTISNALTQKINDDDGPPPQFKRLFTTTFIYKSGRKFQRERKGPNGSYVPQRPSRKQRKLLKIKAVTG
jgi:hypothetical protein